MNSQVFDHTSVIQFLETWLAGKGKQVKETNISDWRRVVCGDLTSTFRPYDDETNRVAQAARSRRDGRTDLQREIPTAAERRCGAHEAGDRDDEHRRVSGGGTRPSCPLPYELVVNGEARDGKLTLTMAARRDAFGAATQGARSTCTHTAARRHDGTRVRGTRRRHSQRRDPDRRRRTACASTDRMASCASSSAAASSDVSIVVDHAGGRARASRWRFACRIAGPQTHDVEIRDESYGAPVRRLSVRGRARRQRRSTPRRRTDGTTSRSGSRDVVYRYAGRVETGKWSITDPAMGERA